LVIRRLISIYQVCQAFSQRFLFDFAEGARFSRSDLRGIGFPNFTLNTTRFGRMLKIWSYLDQLR
jgi:hypothetical protein